MNVTDEMVEAACPRDCGCIVHCRREQVRQAGLLESTPLLPSAADEPHSWMYRSEDPYDAGEWMWSDTKPDRREIFPLFTRPASARPSAGVDSASLNQIVPRAYRYPKPDPDTGADTGPCCAHAYADGWNACRREVQDAIKRGDASAPVAPAAEGWTREQIRTAWIEAGKAGEPRSWLDFSEALAAAQPGAK